MMFDLMFSHKINISVSAAGVGQKLVPHLWSTYRNIVADLTTLLYDKYGRNVGEELRGKVVWITGASAGNSKCVLQ